MSVSLTLGDVAERLGATLRGPHGALVDGVAGIEQAGPSQLAFVANGRYAARARTTRAAAVIVDPDFAELAAPTLRVDNPYLAFARAIELFYTPPLYAPGIHPTASIAPSATIGPGAHVGAFSVVMDDVTLGANATLLPHVTLYPHAKIGDSFFAHSHSVVREYCQIGDRVTLQNGVVVGADGFGFAKQTNGAWYKIVQSGTAILEDDVEVQANACIDRASVGETRVRAGAKIDNLVQVGHGSNVGENTLLCAQVGLAGSTIIGKNVILAGQVGVAGHCTVGDGAMATAQSGIPKDVAPGKVVSGYPAIDNRQWLRSTSLFQRLPELLRTLRGKQ